MGGAQGSAAKWAHAAIALAARALGLDGDGPGGAIPDARTVMTMVRAPAERGRRAPGTPSAATSSPRTPAACCAPGCSAVELDHLDERGLIAYMQDEHFSHSDLLPAGLPRARAQAARRRRAGRARGARARRRSGPAAAGLFDSCIAAVPYAPATAFLANEKAKLDARREDGETPRVAMLADGIGSTHGVTRAIEEIRQRGVPGFEIEVLGTDPNVDRRLSAVAEFDVPYYPGLQIGVPSLSAAVQTLADGCFDVIHVCSPGPVGVAGALVSRGLGVPLVGSYHTELTAYAGLRSGEQGVADAMALGVSAFYRTCDLVLSPSPASDAALAAIGIAATKVARWDRGVDSGRFDPALRGQMALPDAVNVLYSGRITSREGRRPARRRLPGGPRGATPGCTSCSPAAGPSRSACASGSATRPRSSAGWRAPSWRAPMRAPTSSCSQAAPTRSGR